MTCLAAAWHRVLDRSCIAFSMKSFLATVNHCCVLCDLVQESAVVWGDFPVVHPLGLRLRFTGVFNFLFGYG